MVSAVANAARNVPVTNMNTVYSFLPSRRLNLLTKVNEASAKGFFKPVIEDFLMGIMAIDFIALWLPRAWSALFRGAFDYSPQKDPIARAKTGLDEKKYVFKERFKRLNWPNFFEEWWREFASGPGMFVWPTIAYMGFRRYSPHRNSLQLPRTAFKNMARFTEDHANRHGLTSPKQLKMKPLMEEMIDWDRLFGKRVPQQRQASWRREFGAMISNFEKATEEKLALLNKNPNAWFFWSKDRKAFNQKFEAVTHAKKALTDKVHSVNSRYAGSRHMQHDWLPLKMPWGIGGAKEVGAGNFFQRMDEFSYFVDTLKKDASKAVGAVRRPLPAMIKAGKDRLLRAKGATAVAATGLTLMFLFKLVDWTQSNEGYVANRNQDILDLLPSSSAKPKATLTPAMPRSGLPEANAAGLAHPATIPTTTPLPEALFRARQWATGRLPQAYVPAETVARGGA